MAHGISRNGNKVSVMLDDGTMQQFNYSELKFYITKGEIYLDNMYITEGGQLRFIPSEYSKNMARKYTTNTASNKSDARNAGWHSGGAKKPYGFTNKI
jgi:hypothetical protein